MNLYSTPTIYTKTAVLPAVGYARDSRDELILTHLPKVKFIADRIAAQLPQSVERDDLYGAGVVGLMDAIERFDSSRGVTFTTFAEKRVRGAILDNLRSLDWASRATRRRAREIQATYSALEQDYGRPATEVEVAERLKTSVFEIREMLQTLNGLKITHLEECDEETGLSISDLISDTSLSQLDDLQNKEHKELLSAAIDNLPGRERQVIALYYVEELTMREIGEVLSITESRVSQLRTQAITRLRGDLNK